MPKIPGECKIDGIDFNWLKFKTLIVYQLRDGEPGKVHSGTIKQTSRGYVIFEEGHEVLQKDMINVGVAREERRKLDDLDDSNAQRFKEIQSRYKRGNERYRIDHKFSVDEILPLIITSKRSKRAKVIELKGCKVKITSPRLKLFASEEDHQGIVCNDCGLKGTHFYLEKSLGGQPSKTGRYHLNLYGIDEEGDEVLFTKDHIIPKSKGGPNSLKNYQTLCYPCNHDKADDYEGIGDLEKSRKQWEWVYRRFMNSF